MNRHFTENGKQMKMFTIAHNKRTVNLNYSISFRPAKVHTFDNIL